MTVPLSIRVSYAYALWLEAWTIWALEPMMQPLHVKYRNLQNSWAIIQQWRRTPHDPVDNWVDCATCGPKSRR